MGFLSNLFSRTPDHPPLDPNSSAASKLDEIQAQIDELAAKISEPLEIIPGTHHDAYVYIGKPPKKFGLAWIHDGEVVGLNTLVEEHGLSVADVEHIIEELRDAYKHASDAPRFTADVHDHKVVVTPSDKFEKEVHHIIDEITH